MPDARLEDRAVVRFSALGRCRRGTARLRGAVRCTGVGAPGGGGLVVDDVLGEVGGVVVDEAEQCGAAGVLPGQAEEVQPGHVGDAAPVDDASVVTTPGMSIQE